MFDICASHHIIGAQPLSQLDVMILDALGHHPQAPQLANTEVFM